METSCVSGRGDRNVVGEEKLESRRGGEGSGEAGFVLVVDVGSKVREHISWSFSCFSDQSFGRDEKAEMVVIRRGGNKM